MRPSDDNLQYLMELVRAMGFSQTDVTTSHHDFEESSVPSMSDRNTFFKKEGRTVKINEVFVGGSPSIEDYTRVAIILYVAEEPVGTRPRHDPDLVHKAEESWMELFEVDQIVDYFRPEIRYLRIAKILG